MAEEDGVVEKTNKAIDTGYWIDTNSDCIRGPEHDFKFWINNGYICGPFNAGKYYLDEQRNIVSWAGNKPTGFFVKDDRIYGPSKELPWF